MSECLFREKEALTPSDRQGFDRRWSAANLERVYTPITKDDVVDAAGNIQKLYRFDEVQIASGRHCYENFVYNDKTKCIIDVTGIRDFGKDPAKGYFIGTGNSNWDMYLILNNVFGKTLPAGSCYSVGLGGHVTGGGYGLLARLYGLTVDWLTGADVVVLRHGRAELVYCDADNNSDLFWAIRGGGGGNFGIITHYYFKELPRSPDFMYASSISLPWINIKQDTFFEYLQSFSDNECNQNQNFWNNFSIFHINHKMTGALSLSSFAYYDKNMHGNIDDFENSLLEATIERADRYDAIGGISAEPAPHIGHPAWLADNGPFLAGDNDTLPYRKYTYLEGTQNVNGSGPNRYGKYKSVYMKTAISRAQSNTYFDFMSNEPAGADLSSTLFQIDTYGGQVNYLRSTGKRYPQAETPIAQRQSIAKIQYQTYWQEDHKDPSRNRGVAEANTSWINSMYRAAFADWDGYPHAEPGNYVEGCYFNYCDIEMGVNNEEYSMTGGSPIDRAMSLYFGRNYLGLYPVGPNTLSLFDVKQRWNPGNWFCSAQSIPIRATHPPVRP